MEKLKIAIAQAGNDSKNGELIRSICEDPALLELCTPVMSGPDLPEDAVATVLSLSAEPIGCPADATEIIVAGTTAFMPLRRVPEAADIVKFRDILERDLDLRSPRIAIVRDAPIEDTGLADQVTTEHGINTYGPYTADQFLAEDRACHFDGIIAADGEDAVRRIIAEFPMEAPVRYFAGREQVATAAFQPARIEGAEEGMADISALTHPFYTAIDIVRNRASYDEARQDPLPKLYHDKRERGDKGDKTKAES